MPPDEKKDKQLIAAVELLHGKSKAQILAEQTKEVAKDSTKPATKAN